jgi:hypothetical protein
MRTEGLAKGLVGARIGKISDVEAVCHGILGQSGLC